MLILKLCKPKHLTMDKQYTHFIEQWEDKEGIRHTKGPLPINDFNKAQAMSKRYHRMYGYRTIAVFKISWTIPAEQVAALLTSQAV